MFSHQIWSQVFAMFLFLGLLNCHVLCGIERDSHSSLYWIGTRHKYTRNNYLYYSFVYIYGKISTICIAILISKWNEISCTAKQYNDRCNGISTTGTYNVSFNTLKHGNNSLIKKNLFESSSWRCSELIVEVKDLG